MNIRVQNMDVIDFLLLLSLLIKRKGISMGNIYFPLALPFLFFLCSPGLMTLGRATIEARFFITRGINL